MRSTFGGLEIGKRGLFTQQTAMNTAGHNIANANTEGYSRQRAITQATTPIPYPGMQNAKMPGSIGTGVEVVEMKRLREDFLDLQFRNENKNLGYWHAKMDTYAKVEVVFNEPSEIGLQSVIDKFWQSWQDLSKEPESLANRAVVRQQGIAVSETFSYLRESLIQQQADMNNEVFVRVTEINSYAKQIADLNKQIGSVVPHGYQPNDLYDKRDLLLDKLAKLVPIEVKSAANGMVNVTIEGKALITGMTNTNLELVKNPLNNNLYDVVLDGTLLPKSGELAGILESRGYLKDGSVEGILPKMIKDLDYLAVTLAKELNTIHQSGITIDDIHNSANINNGTATPDNIPFYISKKAYEANPNLFQDLNTTNWDPSKIPLPTNASDMLVNPLIQQNLNKIAAAQKDPLNTSTVSFLGDGRNAQEIANLKYKTITEGLPNSSTLDDFYRNMIAQLGVDSQAAKRLYDNSETLVLQVDNNRQSVSGVSIDEEMAELVKYQHSYEANARFITTYDQVLDTLINRTGVAGR